MRAAGCNPRIMVGWHGGPPRWARLVECRGVWGVTQLGDDYLTITHLPTGLALRKDVELGDAIRACVALAERFPTWMHKALLVETEEQRDALRQAMVDADGAKVSAFADELLP